MNMATAMATLTTLSIAIAAAQDTGNGNGAAAAAAAAATAAYMLNTSYDHTMANISDYTSNSNGHNYNNNNSSNNNSNDKDNGNGNNISTSNINSSNNLTFLQYDDEISSILSTASYVGDLLQCYYTPVICCTGTIGNILSVFVFVKTKLRKLSSSFYLAALAVSDTCMLFSTFINWLNFLNVTIYNWDYFCQFFTFLTSLASFCSAWFVVAFTVERFIAVIYPLKRQTMCTVRRAKIVLLALTFVGCMHCAPYLLFATPIYVPRVDSVICDVKSEYKTEITLLNYWDTFIVFVLPFSTIAILNTYTGCTVWKFATVRRTLTMQRMKPQTTSAVSTSLSGCAAGHGSTTYRISTSLKRKKSLTTHPGGQHNILTTAPPATAGTTTTTVGAIIRQQHQSQHQQQQFHYEATQKTGRRKVANSSQLKVTKMLLIVSTVFVCLNLPSFVMRMKTYLETQASKTEMTTVVLQYIFQPLFITNFGINFVLYCVSGQNFRKAVLSIFRRVSATQREGITQVTVSEYCRNTGTSTRRRIMTQHCWNEMHELQPFK